MKVFKNPRAVEFDFKDKTYRIEPDYNKAQFKWWRIGSTHYIICAMQYPAYQLIAPDENWPVVSNFGIYLGEEDMKVIGQFMKQINRAARKLLPKDHPIWCTEVSSGYKAYIRSPEYLDREIY